MPDIPLSGQTAHRQADALWQELCEAKQELARAKRRIGELVEQHAELATIHDRDATTLAAIRAVARTLLGHTDNFPMFYAQGRYYLEQLRKECEK